MVKYQLAWNNVAKVATVQADGAGLPEGSIKAGTFDHDLELPTVDKEGPAGLSHVLYQHVQELLYHQKQENMQVVKIVLA